MENNILTKNKIKVKKMIIRDSGRKIIDINYIKTCSCSPNKLSCLDSKSWAKYQVGVWEFFYEKRDIRDKNIHPAVFPIDLPKRCIELFTHKGELVLDPFVGTGTTLIAAQDIERNAVGFDLNKRYIELANRRINKEKKLFNSNTQQIAIWDDALNINKYLKENTVALCITSPPYANMLNKPRLNKSFRSDLRKKRNYLEIQQYSQNERDLGTMDPDRYIIAIKEIFKKILPLLKPKAHCVININDLWENNKRIPLHAMIIKGMEEVGYELRNIIIWDKRKLVNKVGIFGWPSNYITMGATFEYLLDFWRPE